MKRALLLAALLPGAAPQEADLVLHGGRVHTLEAARPTAQAVAVKEGRILFVGSSAEALALAGEGTRVIDLQGRPLYPGFIDAHAHLAGLALSLLRVDLVGTASYEEVIERVRAAAAGRPEGEWILGRGWDQNDWPVQEFPHHAALSRAVPGHPVLLERVDGHAVLANERAMQAAGVTARTAAGPGGRILRDGSGAPTGVFVDEAEALLRRAVPPAPEAQLREGLRRAIAHLHARGVTGVHDAGVGSALIREYVAMAAAGEFDLRNYVMIHSDDTVLDEWLPGGPRESLGATDRITVRAIKISADGALGSRGAALLADYSDEPGNRGLVTASEARVRAVCERALAAGFQVCVHAIGDAANRSVLDAFAAALAAQPRAGHRFRVEHAQVLHPADIPRFAALGVIPSMQAQHQTSDMPWAAARLGPERVQGAYAWRALLDTGVIIPGGSDCPVEEPDPVAAYHAAVARQDARNQPAGGWHPEQRMTRAEALAHLTIWPAYAAFAEERQGSIRPGKFADLVVLSGDLTTAPFEAIASIRVELTVFDGRVVYTAPGR